ncbi:MAG: carboxypeptidase-like regulatory domain-containing protein, partial [Formivibrio sp.]|nr:carboxypeptidase-like regulatory domain-containing protein [Formivibrio sp.]
MSLRIFALLVLIVGGCLATNAQRITGSIAGNVKDEQGAMVTTAAIKATNVDTGFTRSTAANADGTYLIQYLPVGHYTVEVTAVGFKKFVQQNLI